MDDFDASSWTGLGNNYNRLRNLLKGRTFKQAAMDSWKWFRDKLTRNRDAFDVDYDIASTGGVRFLPRTQQGLLGSPDRYKENITRREKGLLLGRMYFFVYDPKHKDTLPYYDTFPLIFPIKYYKDGFLGINLHYLDIRTRSALFSQLITLATNQRFNDRTRLRISYQILQKIGQMHQPCVKRYLLSHVRSPFIFIHPSEWEQAIFLPVENFEKAPVSRVWRESRKKIG